MLKYTDGSLFDSPDQVLGHSVNCQGAFGKGIAKQIGERYPEVKKAYLKKYHSSGWQLGDIQYVNTECGKIVTNLATQSNYGNNNIQHVNYKALELCIDQLLSYCKENKYAVSIPKISSGLAGGEWEVIEKIIENVSSELGIDVNVYVLKEKVKKIFIN